MTDGQGEPHALTATVVPYLPKWRPHARHAVAPSDRDPADEQEAPPSVRTASPAGTERRIPHDEQPTAVPGASAAVRAAVGEGYPRPRRVLPLLLAVGRM